MIRDEKYYSVVLSLLPNNIQKSIWKCIRKSRPSEILDLILESNDLKTIDHIAQVYSTNPFESAEKIIEACHQKSLDIISFWDSSYPLLLKEISKPPLILYTNGILPDKPYLSIVGTRRADQKSSSIAKRISTDLSGYGFSIVSGMAMGVDREAHLGALEFGGSTIGVLANGIDILYPKINSDLFKMIKMSGESVLISEYPPGTRAGKWTFVQRNRIISGLSKGTVIIQAGLKSGSLITANYAIEQNREVFVCPGYAFSDEFAGCHKLIKNGAVLISKTDDIIEELGALFTFPERNNSKAPKITRDTADMSYFNERNTEEYDESSIEGIILKFLNKNDTDIDMICRYLDYPTDVINQVIMEMELNGKILRNGNVITRQ